MHLEGIDHIALSVRDVERSAKWYVDVLGFEPRLAGMWNGIPTFIGKGTTAIALFPPRARGSAAAPDAGTTDFKSAATENRKCTRVLFGIARRSLANWSASARNHL